MRSVQIVWHTCNIIVVISLLALTYLFSSVSTKPTLAIPPEARGRVKQVVGVHPAGSGLDGETHLQSQCRVLRPHARSETKLSVVSQSNGFLGSSEGQDHKHWTKYLRNRKYTNLKDKNKKNTFDNKGMKYLSLLWFVNFELYFSRTSHAVTGATSWGE